VASRRDAERLVGEGRVRVNGRPASIGQRVDPERDHIEVDGRAVRLEAPVYWVLHKPRGVITTTRDPQGRPTVLDLVPAGRARIYPVGRLDRETEGLLLLTNDGELTQLLLHPSAGSEREYRVTARGRVGPGVARRLERGVRLREGPTAPARVEHLRFDPGAGATTFHLTLIEGRKRQIRRVMSYLGHPVLRLVRVRMGPLRLGDLPPGGVRRPTREELRALERLRARFSGRPSRNSREEG